MVAETRAILNQEPVALASSASLSDAGGQAASEAKTPPIEGPTLSELGNRIFSRSNAKESGHGCEQDLWMTFFFDGTGNNIENDQPIGEMSNVAKLYKAHVADRAERGWHRFYVPGIGTRFGDIEDEGGSVRGLPFGAARDKRIAWALRKFLEKLLFSREAINNMRAIPFKVLIGVAVLASNACGNAGRDANEPGKAEQISVLDEEPISLGINGYNYTDFVINYFSVASQGGGNIAVSSPTSGGGGTVCCINWYPGTKPPIPMEVKWMRYLNGKRRWCKATVLFNGPTPSNPSSLGVHFMPDGSIEIDMTERETGPKLKLPRFSPKQRNESGNAIHDEKFAVCGDTEWVQ